MPKNDAVRAIYEGFARGDMPAVLAEMSPDIVWNEAENFPYADRNPYRGPEAVLTGVFARCGSEWSEFTATPEEIIDAGDTVIALGRYGGVNKKTGIRISLQFAHVWRVREGKAVAFQQYTDTYQARRAAG